MCCQICRCYICDDEVQYSRTGQLAQLVTNLKKQTSADPVKRPQKSRSHWTFLHYFLCNVFVCLFLSACIIGITFMYNLVHHVVFGYLGVKEEDTLLEVEQKAETVKAEEIEEKENKENQDRQKKNTKKESVGKPQKSGTPEDNGGLSVKGLSNLGNTCFFNAVIQVRLCFRGCQSGVKMREVVNPRVNIKTCHCLSQNLSQTQLLRQTLRKVTEEKISLHIKPVASSDLVCCPYSFFKCLFLAVKMVDLSCLENTVLLKYFSS